MVSSQQLDTRTTPTAPSEIRRPKKDLAVFLHGCAFSPFPSTLLQAIRRRHFWSWPGLTESLNTKHLPKSSATSKGHLRMEQKNLNSTKLQLITPRRSSDLQCVLQRYFVKIVMQSSSHSWPMEMREVWIKSRCYHIHIR